MFSNILRQTINTHFPNFDFVLEPFDVRQFQYPTSLDPFDALFITGSRHSAYQDLDWIHALKQFIQKSFGQIVFIGICFGHQILAEALGGQVSKNPLGWEVGVTDIHIPSNEYIDASVLVGYLHSHELAFTTNSSRHRFSITRTL